MQRDLDVVSEEKTSRVINCVAQFNSTGKVGASEQILLERRIVLQTSWKELQKFE
jgi:hypothetical protein